MRYAVYLRVSDVTPPLETYIAEKEVKDRTLQARKDYNSTG